MPSEPERLLTGDEIMELLELEPCEQVGKMLDELRMAQLEKKITTKEQAVKMIKKIGGASQRGTSSSRRRSVKPKKKAR